MTSPPHPSNKKDDGMKRDRDSQELNDSDEDDDDEEEEEEEEGDLLEEEEVKAEMFPALTSVELCYEETQSREQHECELSGSLEAAAFLPRSTRRLKHDSCQVTFMKADAFNTSEFFSNQMQ